MRMFKHRGMSERDAVVASLVDMKKPKKKEQPEDVPKSAYPYGLELTLEDDSLDKLGLDSLPDVGDTFEVHGIGEVIRVSENASERDSSRSICLQITKLALK
jgi:hypothetical protein